MVRTTNEVDMQAETNHAACADEDFIPLHLETRTHVPTKVMCRHLNRKEQTARVWASLEIGPLRPIRVYGRLAWPVAEIKRILLGTEA